MKIILLKDAKKIGRRGEVKDVADGYARNFLIPKNMAVLANDYDLEKLEKEIQAEADEAEQELIQYQELASKVDGMEIEIKTKVGEEDKLFGAITAQQIADKLNKLKENGIIVEKNQIKLTEPIKALGEYSVTIEFPHNLEATIKVIVVPEKPKKAAKS